MARGQQQMLLAIGLTLLVTVSHAQSAGDNSTSIKNETVSNPARNGRPPATAPRRQQSELGRRPLPTGRPNQNITLNDLLNALLNIQKNQLTTTENPAATTAAQPVTNDAVAPAGSTTPNSEVNINDIIKGGGVTNQSVIILNIGDLLGNQLGGANQILNGLNGINCQQGYIYVMLPGGQGKFVPLNQANILPQNGVPSYIILLANGQPNFLHNPNWQQINGILPNLGINIPGLSKIGSIPIYAPTNPPNSGVVDPNLQQVNFYPNNNPSFPSNPNNVVNGGDGKTNYPLYPAVNNPNINFVETPAQPTTGIQTPAPQPINPGVNYPGFNIIQQPAQQMPNFPINPNNVLNGGDGKTTYPLYPTVNNPNINFVETPAQPTTGIQTPAPQPINPGVNYPGFNIIQQPAQQMPNFPINPNNVLNGGDGKTNYPLYPAVNNPNINFVETPAQPTTGIQTPAPQPINPGVNYPGFNIIQQPAQQLPISNIPSNINVPTATVKQPNQYPINTGINLPNPNINWPSQLTVNPGVSLNVPVQSSQPAIPVNSGITVPGLNLNVATQPISRPIQTAYPNEININGTNLINLLKVLITAHPHSGLPVPTGVSPSYITSNVPNLPPAGPSQVGINAGVPAGNTAVSSTSDISLSKLMELLGLKLSNVPSRIIPEIGISQNAQESDLVNILAKQLAASGSNSKFFNNGRVKITIEKGQDESKASVPHLTDMLLHYLNKNSGTLSHGPLRTEGDRPSTNDILYQFLSKTPNLGNNQQIGSGIIPAPASNIKFDFPGQNVGQLNYVPNIPMNIPSNGIMSGQVAADPQYLATLMKTFSGVNLPNNYITGGYNNGVQPLVSQNFGTQPRASMNSVLWNYLLAHLGCVPNDQTLGGNYLPSGGKIFIGNEIPISNLQQMSHFPNMGMSFRTKRAVEKTSKL